MNAFKSIQAIKTASANDLSKVPGISIKLAKEINLFYIHELLYSISYIF